jgi:predicted aspartyl protease
VSEGLKIPRAVRVNVLGYEMVMSTEGGSNREGNNTIDSVSIGQKSEV